MLMGLAGLLFSCGGLFVVLVVSSLLLRAAVSSASRLVKPTKSVDAFEFGNWDDWDSDDPPPRKVPRRRQSSIAEPSIGKGMLVAFVASFVTGIVCSVLQVFAAVVLYQAGENEQALFVIYVSIVTIPVGFCTFTLLLAGMLPTTVKRAALVTLLYHIYGLIIVAGVVVIGWGCMAMWS